MSWLDKEINLKVGKEKKEKVVKNKVRKEKVRDETKKMQVPIAALSYSIMIYFTLTLFAPEMIVGVLPLLDPIFGVLVFLYTAMHTFFALLYGIIVLVLLVMTYSDKLEGKTKPLLPDTPKGPIKFIYSMIKDLYMIYLVSSLGYNYLSVLLVLGMLFVIFYRIIEKDLIAKMTKLTLVAENDDE